MAFLWKNRKKELIEYKKIAIIQGDKILYHKQVISTMKKWEINELLCDFCEDMHLDFSKTYWIYTE